MNTIHQFGALVRFLFRFANLSFQAKMFCHGVDDGTLQPILQMQHEDLEEFQRMSKGKHRENEPPDFELAKDCYKSELASQAQLVADRCMSKSIARAIQTDSEVISALVAQEKQAQRDREAALGVSRGGVVGEDGTNDVEVVVGETPCLDDELLGKLKTFNESAGSTADEERDEDDTLMQPESSSWADSRAHSNQATSDGERKRRECICCLNQHDFTDVACCPCGHEYCRTCLEALVEMSLTDESLFPPRCCSKSIPIEDNRTFLPSKLIGQFRAKALEFLTPDRTYCHLATCSTLSPKSSSGTTSPPAPSNCGQDTATQSLLQLANKNGWQRCYGCRRFVELVTGCYHMTCRCGAQFCYLCGKKWKTCKCAHWNKERLFARANVIVNRDANIPVLQPQQLARRMEREVQNLLTGPSAQPRASARSATTTCPVSSWNACNVEFELVKGAGTIDLRN
ncbi:Putative Zinc finger, RING-type, E3 ubiquitin ligase RBR family, TRIAD [Colletotrichum destructivum]|uniref:RBR-type E3 ubiquitin transferase n=1 Tax=Colletotrichum destructivum TaxID=34406 RepID=A0AAX4IBZ4_9PEZI|nr:Putative Zinc finger, RING-type, E3 ubiquitin ligase RBR family, TRIAD [Colletotrichum destructivum]